MSAMVTIPISHWYIIIILPVRYAISVIITTIYANVVTHAISVSIHISCTTRLTIPSTSNSDKKQNQHDNKHFGNCSCFQGVFTSFNILLFGYSTSVNIKLSETYKEG
jgi:hypothetical protein